MKLVRVLETDISLRLAQQEDSGGTPEPELPGATPGYNLIRVPNTIVQSIDLTIEANSTGVEGTVTIFNLARDSEVRLYKRGWRVTVRAGYLHDTVRNLITARIGRFEREPDSQRNRLIRLHVRDEDYPKLGRAFTRTWSAFVKRRTIIEDVCKVIGLRVAPSIEYVVGHRQLPTANAEEVEDFTFSGVAHELLTEVLAPLQLRYFTRHGILYIDGQDITNDDGQDVLILSEATGLIGTPIRTENGVKIKHLMDARFQIGTRVAISAVEPQPTITESGVTPRISEFEFLKLKIVKVQHQGDNWTGGFFSILECRLYNPFGRIREEDEEENGDIGGFFDEDEFYEEVYTGNN